MDILDDDLNTASPSTIFEELAPDIGNVVMGMGIDQETGYYDPLSAGNFENFDICAFIEENITPIDSPIDPERYLNNNSTQPNQMQPPHLTQQMLNGNSQRMYSQKQQQQKGLNQNGRLPDSPPITDISAGGCSSASPSSGSDDSPFTPDSHHQYRNYINGTNNGYNMSNNNNNNGVLLTMQIPNSIPHPQQLIRQQQIQLPGQTMLLDEDDEEALMRQMPYHLLQQHQQQLSPNQSEFLSPYPPSQSTPGSQHSSQVSPPALVSNQNGNGGQQRFMMTPLSVVSNVDGYNGNTGNPMMYVGSCLPSNPTDTMQIVQNQNGAHKRRRTNAPNQQQKMNSNNSGGGSSSGSSASINNENQCREQLNMNNLAGVVKSEIGGHGTMPLSGMPQQPRLFGMQNQQQNQRPMQPTSVGAQLTPPLAPSSVSQMSFDDYDEGGLQKTIKFAPFCNESWARLYDVNNQALPPLNVQVVADKGFNYSTQDNCFVNQKKNHFQITVNINSMQNTPPVYIGLPGGELLPINEFMLFFCGVKNEMPTSEVQIKQSQTDRKPIPHLGVPFQIEKAASTKQTVPRLHFSETTMNNHRKNGKPNPEQKFFLLVVKIMACTRGGNFMIQAYQSERVIVRASNPGQFEQPESDVAWQKANGNVLTFNGQVAIGSDKPIQDAQLSVMGNVVTTGNISRPSDRRVKENIADVDTKTAMDRLTQMRVVEFSYKPEIAKQWGLTEENRHRVGVIAQELAEVLPDAVRDNGEFLTVDETRIIYETVAAAQELHQLHGNLECKLDQVERISHKLGRYMQKRKNLGSMASGLSDFSNLFGTANNGNDNKSYLSYSRTSLASSSCEDSVSQAAGKRSSKNHRRSCRGNGAYCQRGSPNGELCTSKVTQGTIVTLVVIMALCLMSMCTLYVMDWYNRTYVYGPHHLGHHYQMKEHSTAVPPVGLYYEKIKEKGFSWKIPLESKAPPLAAICGQRSHCPMFCCAAPHRYDFYDEIPTNTIDQIVSWQNTTHVSTTPFLNDVLAADESAHLESGVRIEVLNLNAVLDMRYCAKDGICDLRKGRYDLYVPVSPYLPTIPLLLKINVDDGLFVDNCGGLVGFNHTVCEIDSEADSNAGHVNLPLSNRVTENVFELSVGGYLQSAYRFRVGHTTESCQMHDDQLGRSYDEYNILFYRTCPSKTSSIPTKTESTKVANLPKKQDILIKNI